MNILTF